MRTSPATPLVAELPIGTNPFLRCLQDPADESQVLPLLSFRVSTLTLFSPLPSKNHPGHRTDFSQGPLQLPGEQPAATYLHFPRLLPPEMKRQVMRLESAYEVSYEGFFLKMRVALSDREELITALSAL